MNPNEYDEHNGAWEWTAQTLTNPTSPTALFYGLNARRRVSSGAFSPFPCALRLLSDHSRAPLGSSSTTTRAHGNRTRQLTEHTRMDPTLLYETADPQGSREWIERTRTMPTITRTLGTLPSEPDDAHGGREWIERTQTNPTITRAHLNGPSAHERTRRHQGRTGMVRTHPTIPRAHGNGPNAPERTPGRTEAN